MVDGQESQNGKGDYYKAMCDRRRFFSSTDSHATRRLQRDSNAQFEWRLHFRCLSGGGRRHRDCTGCQHGRKCCVVRGDAWYAPKYAGQDKVNPGSLVLSAEMMLRHMGWSEAAELILKGVSGAIEAKTVTYDFERLMPDATLLRTREFGDAIIRHM